MAEKLVKELMTPISDYGSVDEDAVLLVALNAMDDARAKLGIGSDPARAVIVTDKAGDVIGQLGHLDFLVALEPKYSLIGNLDLMSRSGLSPDFLDQMNENFSLFTEEFDNMLRRSAQVKVKQIMRPLRESIEEDAPITDAVHKMVMWQSMRMLVTRQGKAVGILRLVELFREVSERMRALQRS